MVTNVELPESLKSWARTYVKEELIKVLPVHVRVSFGAGYDDELGSYVFINAFWPKYTMSWIGKPEEHKYRAQELVKLSFNRNAISRFVGLMVAPYVSNYVGSNPMVLLPRTDVEYPEGRVKLRVLVEGEDPYSAEFEDYFKSLVSNWSEELSQTVLKERGA